MVKNKDVNKPRGRMSSYAFFVQKTREDFKKKHPNESVGFAEFSKKCSDQWKKMSDSEKKKFITMADKDRKRYDNEMQSYVPPSENGKEGKKEKKKKDPDAPKRPLTAFFWYCNDERSRVRATMPAGSAMGDVAKLLSVKWNSLEPSAKAKYEHLAQKDKIRYEKEVATYKAKGGGSASGAISKPARGAAKGRGKPTSKKQVELSEDESDDDDDEDEDDDDNNNDDEEEEEEEDDEDDE